MMVNNSDSLQEYDFVANKLLSPFFSEKGVIRSNYFIFSDVALIIS